MNEISQKRKIKGFKDVFTSIIYTLRLADIVDRMIDRNLSGIFNCVSSDSLSKYDFAVKLAEHFHLDSSLIIPDSVDHFSFKAKRSKNLSLDTQKLSKSLQCSLPAISESIESFYKDYQKGVPQKLRQGQDSNVGAFKV